jgi:type I restriction enzyme M protein
MTCVSGHDRLASAVVPVGSSEFRVYPDIRDNLRRLDWNTNNPATDPTGEVYDQHEFAVDTGLKKALGGQAPEHTVIVNRTKRIFWVIEAKPQMKGLSKAISEARSYADAINSVAKPRCAFYTGIAGSSEEGFLRQTFYIDTNGIHAAVNYDGSPITSLVHREVLEQIIKADSASLPDLILDETELLGTARVINETLHGASINKDDRAAVVASILLTMAIGDMPDATLPPDTYAEEVNLHAKARLAKANKAHFADHIALRLPKGIDAQRKFVGAVIATADALRHINIAAAMRSGTDILGEFYEAFLKYGNGAKDLGIVLTPRHITRWAADVVPLDTTDIVYDPTCGTGGFLVSAYDDVRSRHAMDADFDAFRTSRIFGIDQQPKIAALAVVNMIFRGDGSTNIVDDNALKQFLVYANTKEGRSAKFVTAKPTSGPPGATRVLMNPPFALKKDDEKEYEFVEHALRQTEDGGLVFAVLPSPVMVKSGAPLVWRRDRLLAANTLRAVVAFPEDLFYPSVSVDTVGVVIEKGRPHVYDKDEVLWALAATDGYAKVKGARLRSSRVPDLLAQVTEDVRKAIASPRHKVQSIPGLIKKTTVDRTDDLCELLPQVYLDEPEPTPAIVRNDMQHAVREYLAFLIRTADAGTLATALVAGAPKAAPTKPPHAFELWQLTELFDEIDKGSVHSLNVEDPGMVPVVSSSTENNGIHGFFDLDPAEWPRWRNIVTVASNGTPLTSFYHPYEIVPKDDVIVCRPDKAMPVETIMYLITALNAVTWRFSYYRKAYLNKVDKILCYVPVTKSGDIDHAWIKSVADSCDGWTQLRDAMSTWQPRPFSSLGRRAGDGRSIGGSEPEIGPDDKIKIEADPEDALRALLQTKQRVRRLRKSSGK